MLTAGYRLQIIPGGCGSEVANFNRRRISCQARIAKNCRRRHMHLRVQHDKPALSGFDRGHDFANPFNKSVAPKNKKMQKK